MSHRLSRITTRTGDDGTTGLADGTRLAKDHPRIAALGELDELNSALGVVRAWGLPADADAVLAEVQQRLFDLGSELALPAVPGRLGEAEVLGLDQALRTWNACLPPLREFILPGGVPAAAATQLARANARRAERAWVGLHRTDTLNPYGVQYLNRLSDLLFVLARRLNHLALYPEPQWQGGRNA